MAGRSAASPSSSLRSTQNSLSIVAQHDHGDSQATSPVTAEPSPDSDQDYAAPRRTPLPPRDRTRRQHFHHHHHHHHHVVNPVITTSTFRYPPPISSRPEPPTPHEDAHSHGFQKACLEFHILEYGYLEGRRLRVATAIVGACSFLMFGYDQGVLSGLLTLREFQDDIPLMAPGNTIRGCRLDAQCQGTTTIQAAAVGIYQAACFLGAIAVLLWGNGWGRRASTFLGAFIIILGTIIQASATGSVAISYALFVLGRIVAGIGNGIITASVPTWQSECAKPEMRGKLVMTSGALISGGIALSYLMNLAFYYAQGSVRWRGPIAMQIVPGVIVLIGIILIPESPRWLLLKGRPDDCRAILARFSGQHEHSLEVDTQMRILLESHRVESLEGPFHFSELLTNGIDRKLQRTLLAVGAQTFQQLTGINLTTYYLSLLFEQSLGLEPELSRILSFANGVWYFFTSLVAIPLIERLGRRKLLMVGSIGMTLSFVILAGLVSTGGIVAGIPVLRTSAAGGAVVMIFLYVGFFGMSYLGLTWLYPAEIAPLRIRIQANGLSTAANWWWNFVVVMVTPPGLSSIGWGMYLIFGFCCLVQFPLIYLFFPETSQRSLEELDVVFAKAFSEEEPVLGRRCTQLRRCSAVETSLKMKRLEGEDLDNELRKYFGPEASRRRQARGTGSPTRETWRRKDREGGGRTTPLSRQASGFFLPRYRPGRMGFTPTPTPMMTRSPTALGGEEDREEMAQDEIPLVILQPYSQLEAVAAATTTSAQPPQYDEAASPSRSRRQDETK